MIRGSRNSQVFFGKPHHRNKSNNYERNEKLDDNRHSFLSLDNKENIPISPNIPQEHITKAFDIKTQESWMGKDYIRIFN